MTEPDCPDRPPYWLWQTKRLFPNRLFAGCVSLAFLCVGVLFVLSAAAVYWPIGILSLIFFAGAFATAAAAFTSSTGQTPAAQAGSGQAPTNKPTFAIFVLLIGVYSWLLTLGVHVFHTFFQNGPGSTKYYVTVGIAIASTLFMLVYGRRVIRRHFGTSGGRNVELSTSQAVYVVIFVVCCGMYMVWLVS